RSRPSASPTLAPPTRHFADARDVVVRRYSSPFLAYPFPWMKNTTPQWRRLLIGRSRSAALVLGYAHDTTTTRTRPKLTQVYHLAGSLARDTQSIAGGGGGRGALQVHSPARPLPLRPADALRLPHELLLTRG